MLNSVGTQSLDTPRLLLRRFQRGDGKSAFRNWCGDAAVTTYLKWTAHPYPLATEQVVNRWIREYHDPLCFHWAITRREYGDVIGGIGLTVWDAADERAELGYSLGSAFWGRGFGREAAAAVLRFGFETVGFHRIEAICAAENQASIGLLTSLGFQEEGFHRQVCRLGDGRFVDCRSFALLATEYRCPERSVW